MRKHKHKHLLFGLAVMLGFFSYGSLNVHADRDQGVDWSVYQGATGKWGNSNDKFALCQIGGITPNGVYNQWTYPTQISSGLAQGKRMHTYIWYQVGNNQYLANEAMNYFLPRIQTPKGSIVALDYESGASWDKEGNTDAILTGMRRIRDAGYTPVYYSYKPYTLQHVDTQRILNEFPNSLWIAAYPDYQVRQTPYYPCFPSMNGVGMWQFTSTYIAGGLDGNVDLLNLTQHGYTHTDQPKTNTPAVKVAKQIDNTPHRDIKVGDQVKVHYSASRWSTGQYIPSWVKNNTYPVIQVSGNRILLGNVMSWISKYDVELVDNGHSVPVGSTNQVSHSNRYYTVRYGDTLSGIAYRYGTSWQHLAQINHLSNPNYLYVGERIAIDGNVNRGNNSYYYIVHYGDCLSAIASRYHVSVSYLQRVNHISNPNLIYVGQRLVV